MHPLARGATVTLTTAALAAVGIVVPVSAASAAEPTALFISEVVEGSSNNKAVEVFNPTDEAIALDGVSLKFFFNGAATAGLTIPFSGSVEPGEVVVAAHASAAAPILAQADVTNGAGWFNGDDAIALVQGDTTIDVFGQVGFDPGTEWGSGLNSTADNTLRRAADVCGGDPNATDAFDPSAGWVGFATDTFTGLGSHESDCGDAEPPATPVINEFSANTVGSTDVEYLEVLAAPGTDLSAYTLLEVEGDTAATPPTGVVDGVFALGTADADGRVLIELPNGELENGTLSLLLVTGAAPAPGADLDAENDGVIDASTGLTLVDSVAVNDGGAGDVTYGPVVLGVAYDGQAFAPGGASRIPDGTDTDSAADWVRNDFDLAGIAGNAGTLADGEAVNTPGAENTTELDEGPGPIEADCDAPFVSIGSVQGASTATPVPAGQEVQVEGVVVGDFQAVGGFDGYYLQDSGDGDPATSDGVFVFAPGGTDVALGDVVHVVGTMSEFFGMTELTAIAASVCDTGAELPAPTELTLPLAPADRERYEGMRVSLPQTLKILETFEYAQFGLITLGSERQFQPTATFEPGSPEAIALAAANAADSIGLDDARGSQNPDPALHPNGQPFTLENAFRGGDLVTDATGVLDYRFDQWSVQPTQPAEFAAGSARPGVPEVGGDLRVASFNVLNYFTDLDTDAPGTDFRGANTAEEFERQEAKIVAAITAIDADVVGLIEIQNNNDGAALEALVAALNEVAGAGTYASIHTGTLGTDAITTALIYQPAAVTPAGAYAVLDETVDPRFDTDRNRPALAQTFTSNETGEAVTVVVNHLKSKGSACGAADPDLGDGQGNCNLTRTAAAGALVDWLAGDPTGQGTVGRELIIGDLNSYDHEDPIEVLTGAGYVDLEKQFNGEDAYSYVFDGQLGYLDYALAGTALAGDVTGASAWHINSDEPSIIDYDMTFKKDAQDALFAPDPYRSSDHDPIVVGISLTPPDTTAPTLTVKADPSRILLPTYGWRTVRVTPVASDDSGEATVEFVKVTTSGRYAEVRKVSDTTFQVRAVPGTVYTFEYRATDAAGNATTATASTRVGTVWNLFETILDWLFG